MADLAVEPRSCGSDPTARVRRTRCQVAGYFPAPLCALRTLKAELGCGMSEESVDRASSSDPEWLTNGRWGVVQFFKP